MPRRFKDLRLSLTNLCNLSCRYCTGVEDDAGKRPRAGGKPPVDTPGRPLKGPDYRPPQFYIERVRRLHHSLQLDSVRLTGGEPTLYPYLTELIGGLAGLGVGRIAMTTNGYYSGGNLAGWVEAGLTGVNFSLDSLDVGSFQTMTRRPNLQRVLDSVEEAVALRDGLSEGLFFPGISSNSPSSARLKIKANTTIMRGINDDQILPLVDYFGSRTVPLRFIELMRMGPLFDLGEFERYFVGAPEILATIGTRYELTGHNRRAHETARYFQTGTGYEIGIIANESEPFCGDCDRLRLDSSGRLYGCLSSDVGFDMPSEVKRADVDDGVNRPDPALDGVLDAAMAQKQKRQFTGSSLSMQEIGG